MNTVRYNKIKNRETILMNLIPQPQELLKDDGSYTLPEIGLLSMPCSDSRLTKSALLLLKKVNISDSPDGFYSLCCGNAMPHSSISIKKEYSDSYELDINTDGLRLQSYTAAGLFYGLQTLRQLANAQLPCLTIHDWAFTSLRCDHYDMRTVYPTFSHMLDYIKEMAQYKINALMIEYEDKFPFTCLKELRHPHALTAEQVQEILKTAYDNFIEIIPLQQSYGHLEYVLKHPSYIDLREELNHVAALCPSNPRSYDLVCSLLQDIAQMHPQSHYLHLGCDEVWSIGKCKTCQTAGLNSSMLFIRFINRLAAFTLKLGKQPIIWHDMLKDATDEELGQLDRHITIAVWIYSGRHITQRAITLVKRLKNAGLQVLGAPSVRCWDECATQNYPVVENRLSNINDWIDASHQANLDGLIFTNWSASLALGNPYGLFESTRYLTFYACERAWNPTAPVATYPKRFFTQYHGITDAKFLEESFTLTDYYKVPEELLILSHNNHLTLRFLAIMRKYEEPLKSGLPLQDLLFQGEIFPDNEEIITFLQEKYKENYTLFDQVRPAMHHILEELLPSYLVDLYLCSRFFLPDKFRALAQKMLHL